jgi:hypothetical protein
MAFRDLHRGGTEATAVAGMRTRHVSHPSRPFTAQHVPFFDKECKELKREVQRERKRGGTYTAEYKAIERQSS